MPPTRDQCGTCQFAALKGLPQQTVCVRYPPAPINSRDAYWPVVKENDWCGEFKKL